MNRSLAAALALYLVANCAHATPYVFEPRHS